MTGPDPKLLDQVALAALELVEPRMLLGLGTGKAAEAFLRRLGERAKELGVRGVPTSERSDALAREVGIPVVGLAEAAEKGIDVAFDGADEVTPELGLTKGLGGAQLRERVVAAEARRFVVLVTPEKLVPKLGTRCGIPVEVVPFAVPTVWRRLQGLGGVPEERKKGDGAPYRTDNGNAILDVRFAGGIDDPVGLDAAARRIAGVVDVGLFLGMASVVLVGAPEGVRRMEASRRS